MSSVCLEFKRQVVLPLTRNDRNLVRAHITKFMIWYKLLSTKCNVFFTLNKSNRHISGFIINVYCFIGNFLSYFFVFNGFTTSTEREWILFIYIYKKRKYNAEKKLTKSIPVIREGATDQTTKPNRQEMWKIILTKFHITGFIINV